MTKLLNRDQAEAIYNAMMHMNNVFGTICGRLDGIKFEAHDSVEIEGPDDGTTGKHKVEHYTSQNAFATAYGLD